MLGGRQTCGSGNSDYHSSVSVYKCDHKRALILRGGSRVTNMISKQANCQYVIYDNENLLMILL